MAESKEGASDEVLTLGYWAIRGLAQPIRYCLGKVVDRAAARGATHFAHPHRRLLRSALARSRTQAQTGYI